MIEEEPNWLVLEVNAPADGWLVLADTWYPGWRAWVDGQPETIWKANYLFQAIEVPAGNHYIVLAYRPGLFLVGLAISCLALIGLSGLLLYVRRNSS
jgi:uncharacterized membrane protein YfhO